MSVINGSLRKVFDSIIKVNPEIALRLIKGYYNELVDREFINGFTTIHWNNLEDIQGLMSLSNNNELSTQAYTSNNLYECGWVGGVGALIEGDITLAGNSDLQTLQWTSISREEKFTDYIDELIINEQNCFEPYEFVVKNWEIKSLVIDYLNAASSFTTIKDLENPEVINELMSLTEQVRAINPKLPLIDFKGQEIKPGDESIIKQGFFYKPSYYTNLKIKGEEAGVYNDCWGHQGAGLLITNEEFNEVFLVKRSNKMFDYQGFWSVPGGAVRELNEVPDDSLATAVNKSIKELGSIPQGDIIRKSYNYWCPSNKSESSYNDFQFKTYIMIINDEQKDSFKPVLNWENNDCQWFKVKDLPYMNLHPGLDHLIKNMNYLTSQESLKVIN